MIKFVISGVACSLLVATPTFASKPAVKDPNKIICKSDNSTGTRLTQAKQCMTAAQWDEQRRINREEIDKIQTSRYKNGSNG